MIPLNDDTRAILGRPCFLCGHIAEILRLDGAVIERKAEAEQAAVIHWLLSIYEESPATWAEVASERLRAIKQICVAQPPAEAVPA